MFPGQGSQYNGMGKDLFNEFPEVVENAKKILGYDIVDICINNPNNTLNQTNYTQPALFLLNFLHYQKYLKSNQTPDYFLGHSLGEFNALCAAGVFDFETGLKIVQKRGELMFSIVGTGMAAIIGADYSEIQEILKNNFPEIDIANINSASQIVISGKLESLEKAADYFEEDGLVYVPLKVSGAFHSRYMTPIKNEFKEFIESMPLHQYEIPIISNYTASLYPKELDGIINNMANQINSPIKWLQSIEYLMSQGESNFFEIGPGEVLSNILKKIKTKFLA
jgi:trans-AT polyketide synthase/acyltransferase/oxidoreductase domain-containing protein